MLVTAAKLIGAGVATVGLTGAGIGIVWFVRDRYWLSLRVFLFFKYLRFSLNLKKNFRLKQNCVGSLKFLFYLNRTWPNGKGTNFWYWVLTVRVCSFQFHIYSLGEMAERLMQLFAKQSLFFSAVGSNPAFPIVFICLKNLN